MSRHRYVVCYDIREAARLRRTHDTMLGFGDPLQYSVFVCELSTSERLLMEDAVRQVAALDEDSVLVIDLGPASGVARARIRVLGKGRVPERQRLTIV
jgi:CRISPR-associated protein Cas2